MKILVIGSGSIAQRHISNLLLLGHEVLVHSKFFEGRDLVIDGVKLKIIEDPKWVEYGGVVIANSTNEHMQFGLNCANFEIPIFIEKPLSNSFDLTYEFVNIVEKKKLVVEAGFMLHAHKQINQIKTYISKKSLGEICYVRAAVGQWLPDWRPGREYKTGYASMKDQGGGVLLDLIHEVELVQSLFGKIHDKRIYTGNCRKLEIETESIATINGIFENGAICHIEMDYIRRNYVRELEIVGDLGSLYWDYSKQRLILSQVGRDDIVNDLSDQEFNRNDMYLDHMRHFIARIENPSIGALSHLHESMAALETVLEN